MRKHDSQLTFSTVYVNDFTILSRPEQLADIKCMLSDKFQCKDLSEV